MNELNFTPTQVSIEAKFVEIEQTNLDTLGFRWSLKAGGAGLNVNPLSLTDPSDATKRDGKHNLGIGGSAGSQFQLGIAKETENFTQGLRLATDVFGSAVNDEMFSVYSILGNYAFQTTLYAIQQEKHSDVLSAPKVTTISGQTAQIKVVTIRYFPESWTEPEYDTDGDNGAVSYTPSTPEFGDSQDIGVILDVTPTVSPDGYSIDVELEPQVIEFLGYDTSFNTTMILEGREIETKIGMMPILTNRRAKTKLVIWDGETIVLGGMIQEKLTKYEDKVPFLGSLPVLGHLFSMKGEESVKTNLLMFVNARLVTPAGLPIRANDLRGLPDFRH